LGKLLQSSFDTLLLAAGFFIFLATFAPLREL
jgi:hypothetical protein